MKLGIFDYVNQAIELLDEERPLLTKAAMRLNAHFEKLLAQRDEVVAVTNRVKTSDSFKEKIIRNNLYKRHTVNELLYNVSDLIGLRVECRFLADEEFLYGRIKQIFDCTDDGSYYYAAGKKNIRLKLDTVQPEKQKNGLDIYRIDGKVNVGDKDFNFELQIKSLVNSFWSEIEHKIIYKNKRFMLIDNFVGELMSSINENLVNIDRQLNMLFDKCAGNVSVDQDKQVMNMLIIFINEVYTRLVESRAGFTISIKEYSEALAKYLLMYSSFKSVGENGVRYGELIMNVISWMKNINYDNVHIGEEICLSTVPDYHDPLRKALAEKILAHINDDFYCNTFFHILFSLEVGNDSQDFNSYINYYALRVGKGKTQEDADEIIEKIQSLDVARLLREKYIRQLEEIGAKPCCEEEPLL